MENNDFSSNIGGFSVRISTKLNFRIGNVAMPIDATKSKKCTAKSFFTVFWMEKLRISSFTIGCGQVLVEKQL